LTGEHWRVELGVSLKGGRPAEGPEMGEFYPCQKHHRPVGIRCQSRGKILFQGLPFMITRFGIICRYLLRWKHPPTCVSGLPISVIQYELKEIFDPDWQALFIRFVFNMVMVQLLTRLFYYRKGRKKSFED
jgi:hypothetical protein